MNYACARSGTHPDSQGLEANGSACAVSHRIFSGTIALLRECSKPSSARRLLSKTRQKKHLPKYNMATRLQVCLCGHCVHEDMSAQAVRSRPMPHPDWSSSSPYLSSQVCSAFMSHTHARTVNIQASQSALKVIACCNACRGGGGKLPDACWEHGPVIA